MTWTVVLHPDLQMELDTLPPNIVTSLQNATAALSIGGPALGRPQADSLNGSRHSNMKELRLPNAWRFAFAFDPARRAVMLCGGSKAGVAGSRFYTKLVRMADARYEDWLSRMEG